MLTMTKTKQIPNNPDREPFRKMRNDREIGNVSNLPKDAIEGCRKDMQIGTLLDKWNVRTVEELKKKFRKQNRLKKFNQRLD
ncbi:hypothetical protein NKOR_04070 [Candidatus Nitrosopumilus koreensis AR1]|uniref:Uncharacterized protein n=2 Tax=Nitrosopumilaceae TaxID=338190 RepID=K0B5G2_9ARCH|nr:hypothetical protein NKOR_04070 [Candidatus Nitrosopumilus koreensis AR1]